MLFGLSGLTLGQSRGLGLIWVDFCLLHGLGCVELLFPSA